MGFRYATGRLYKPKAAGGVFFDPTSISGLKLWLDFSDASTLYTDAGSTLVSSDGDAIYQANDKSGNGYNATQTSSGSRPLYKTNQQNGLSVSYYNNDRLYLSNDLRALLDKTVTFFAVTKFLAAGNDGFGTKYWTANEFLYCYGASATQWRFVWSTNLVAEPSNTSNYDNYFIKGFRWNSVAQRVDIYSNGASVNNDAPALNTSLAGSSANTLTVGTIAAAVEHYFGELLVYTESLSDSDMANIANYLNTKWSIY